MLRRIVHKPLIFVRCTNFFMKRGFNLIWQHGSHHLQPNQCTPQPPKKNTYHHRYPNWMDEFCNKERLIAYTIESSKHVAAIIKPCKTFSRLFACALYYFQLIKRLKKREREREDTEQKHNAEVGAFLTILEEQLKIFVLIKP